MFEALVLAFPDTVGKMVELHQNQDLLLETFQATFDWGLVVEWMHRHMQWQGKPDRPLSRDRQAAAKALAAACRSQYMVWGGGASQHLSSRAEEILTALGIYDQITSAWGKLNKNDKTWRDWKEPLVKGAACGTTALHTVLWLSAAGSVLCYLLSVCA